jgi:NAD(P)-dependent dehydrogenase (short-subunit alcohol dehydrogenase family)
MPTCLIIGANRGIGLALVKTYHLHGYRVLATSRTPSDVLESLAERTFTGIDVNDNDTLSSLAQQLHNESIDVLICNAGIWDDESIESFNDAKIMHVIETNALGPLRVVKYLLPRLKTGSKIAFITSRMGSITDNESGGRYSYRMSKAALNAAGKSLSIDLKDRGVAVIMIHPGWVKTDMSGQNATIKPEAAARGIIDRINELTLAHSGSFVHQEGESLPW